MPAEKGCRLHNSYDLAPIKPAPEPDQDEAGGVGGTLGCGVMLLIQRELFAQEEVFCRKGWAGAQTEEEKSPRITHKREQEASKAHQVIEPSGIAGHREGSSQRQKVVFLGYYPSWEAYRPERFRPQCYLASSRAHPPTARHSDNCGPQL